jgi:hypothetical protein
LKYNDEDNNLKPPMIQLPDLYMNDDIKRLDSNYVTYEILLPLLSRNINTTQLVKSFFQSLDNKIVQDAKQYNTLWNLNPNIKYKMLIKNIEGDNVDNIYDNGIIKLKFIKSKGFNTRVYDCNKNIIKEKYYTQTLTGNCYIKSIIELVAIWIKDEVFGLYIRPHQLKVTDSGKLPVFSLKDYSFIDDTESDKDEQLLYDTEANKTPTLEVPDINILNQQISVNDNDSNTSTSDDSDLDLIDEL